MWFTSAIRENYLGMTEWQKNGGSVCDATHSIHALFRHPWCRGTIAVLCMSPIKPKRRDLDAIVQTVWGKMFCVCAPEQVIRRHEYGVTMRSAIARYFHTIAVK